MKRVIIGSDHAGFSLKEAVKVFLSEMEYSVTDVGTQSPESVDYPDFGVQVAKRVSAGEFNRGILVCGSGVGMVIVANKFPLIRAVHCLDVETACMSRLHNDSNILVLAERRTDADTAKSIVQTWLNTEFEGGRHERRINKIKDIELQIYKQSQDTKQ